MEVMVEGFREGKRLAIGAGKMEEEGDIGGEWREDFRVGMMGLFKTSTPGLEYRGENGVKEKQKEQVQNDNI